MRSHYPPAAYRYIESDDGVAALVDALRASRIARLAIDVEGENNLHRYGIHVALIQLFDGRRGYIVDPLALSAPRVLSPLLERAAWTLVWFDAGNDLLTFQHALGLRPSPLFDCAIAARLLGRNGGLHSLTGQEGSASAKDRFQRANWLRRPLAPALLDYAISDVVALLDLADELSAEVELRGLSAELQKRTAALQETPREWNPFANYTRIPGFNRLNRADRGFARLLWCGRECYARAHDVPPANVASKEEMRRLIDKGARDPREIARVLNANRQRDRVDAEGLAASFEEARGIVEKT